MDSSIDWHRSTNNMSLAHCFHYLSRIPNVYFCWYPKGHNMNIVSLSLFIVFVVAHDEHLGHCFSVAAVWQRQLIYRQCLPKVSIVTRFEYIVSIVARWLASQYQKNAVVRFLSALCHLCYWWTTTALASTLLHVSYLPRGWAHLLAMGNSDNRHQSASNNTAKLSLRITTLKHPCVWAGSNGQVGLEVSVNDRILLFPTSEDQASKIESAYALYCRFSTQFWSDTQPETCQYIFLCCWQSSVLPCAFSALGSMVRSFPKPRSASWFDLDWKTRNPSYRDLRSITPTFWCYWFAVPPPPSVLAFTLIASICVQLLTSRNCGFSCETTFSSQNYICTDKRNVPLPQGTTRSVWAIFHSAKKKDPDEQSPIRSSSESDIRRNVSQLTSSIKVWMEVSSSVFHSSFDFYVHGLWRASRGDPYISIMVQAMWGLRNRIQLSESTHPRPATIRHIGLADCENLDTWRPRCLLLSSSDIWGKS